jgi:hypothetical protein
LDESEHDIEVNFIWCQWANTKAVTKSVQYTPKLLINNQLIPKIDIGEAYQYLGPSFISTSDNHRTDNFEISDELRSMMTQNGGQIEELQTPQCCLLPGCK